MERNFAPNKLEIFRSYYFPKTGSRYEVFNEMYTDDVKEEEVDNAKEEKVIVSDKKVKSKSKKYKK
jgi:hypothetical protein